MKTHDRLKQTIFTLFHRKNCYTALLNGKNGNDNIQNNIYNFNGTMKNYVKLQVRVHKWFKVMLLNPFVLLVKKVLGKHLRSTIPDDECYRNIKVFNDTFEATLPKWVDLFQAQFGDSNKTLNEKHAIYEHNIKGSHVQMLRDIKNIFITGIMNDSAYMELFNMLLLELTVNMNKEYKSDKVNHLMYNSKSINNVAYFVIRKQINNLLTEVKPTFSTNGHNKHETKD